MTTNHITLPREQQIALRDAHETADCDEYFKARHEMLDTIQNRRTFEAGFKRGWDALQALAAQQPEPEATEGEANVEKLRSAVNLALTYFGMDEDDSNREVFKALREADEQTPTLAAHINRCVTLFGSLRKMADALDMDAGYLSRLRSGEKIEPSAEVLSKLGLRKTVTYSKTNHGIYEATPLIPRTRSA